MLCSLRGADYLVAKDSDMKKQYKHAKERYGYVYVHGTYNGKRYRLCTDKPATAKNMNWVDQNWLKVLQGLIEKTPECNIEEGATVEMVANKYIAGLDLREHTMREYKAIIENYILHSVKRDGMKIIEKNKLFKDISVAAILPSDLKVWQKRLIDSGLSGSRVHNIRTVFRGIMKNAADDKIIPENPFDAVDGVSKGDPEIYPLLMNEIKEMISNTDGFFKNMLTVAFFTGMRTGEMIALRWEDINFTSNTIHIRRATRGGITDKPKTSNSIREIDMLPVVKDALKKQFHETGLSGKEVFLSSRGDGFRSSKSLTKNYWHSLLKRCNLPSRDFYNTRHTFASLMLSHGEDVLWVAQMMGHKDSSITLKRYAKYRKDISKERATFLNSAMNNQVEIGTNLAPDENISKFKFG
jgi:integrase